MKTALKSDFKLKTFCIRKSYVPLKKQETKSDDSVFYQKVFVVLISLFSILIFPEMPRELENICANHNSKELCNVW